MRVLVLINSLGIGGGEASAVMMANALATLSDVEVDFGSGGGPLRQRLSEQVTFHPVQDRAFVLAPTKLFLLRRIVRRIQPDVIHVHGARLAVAVHLSLNLLTHRPPVVMTHHSRGFGRVPRVIARSMLRRCCRHVVAVSEEMREELSAVIGRPDGVSVIPHAMDVRRFGEEIPNAVQQSTRCRFEIPDQARVILISSRLVVRKGLEVFIETIDALNRDSTTPVVGIIAGDGPLRPQLTQKVAELGAGNYVKFAGFQSDVRPLLAVTDLVLFPSEEEMLPVFLVESSAAGVPVVASNLPGIREVVTDGTNGFLVKDRNDYQDRVKRLLGDERLRTEFGRAGRELARQKFDSEKIARDLTTLYNTLLST